MIAQAFFESYGVLTEGLFRISPEKPVLDALVQKFDDGSPVDISSYSDSGHTMAGLLKRYFREMPEPLVPYDLYEAFVTAVTTEGHEDTKALRLQKIASLLSAPRYATLRALMEICCLVAHEQKVNKMGAENLAVVFAPTLFRPRGGDLEQQMRDTPRTTDCVMLFINHFDRIFPSDEEKKAQQVETRILQPVTRGHAHTKSQVEKFVPLKPVEMPALPSLPPLPQLARVKNPGKRGSVTLDNAQLGMPKVRRDSVLESLVGQRVWALYQGDTMWYPAELETVDVNGMGIVVFTDYGNKQVCLPSQISVDPPASPSQTPMSSSPALPNRRDKTLLPGSVRQSDQMPVAPPRAPGRSGTTLQRNQGSKSTTSMHTSMQKSAPSIPSVSPRTLVQLSPRSLPPNSIRSSPRSPARGEPPGVVPSRAPAVPLNSPQVGPRPPVRPSGLSASATAPISLNVGDSSKRIAPLHAPPSLHSAGDTPASPVIPVRTDLKPVQPVQPTSPPPLRNFEQQQELEPESEPEEPLVEDLEVSEPFEEHATVVAGGSDDVYSSSSSQHFLEDAQELPLASEESGGTAGENATVSVEDEAPPAYAEFGDSDDDGLPDMYAAPVENQDDFGEADVPPLPARTPDVLEKMAGVARDSKQ